jgi:hypothetical protein
MKKISILFILFAISGCAGIGKKELEVDPLTKSFTSLAPISKKILQGDENIIPTKIYYFEKPFHKNGLCSRLVAHLYYGKIGYVMICRRLADINRNIINPFDIELIPTNKFGIILFENSNIKELSIVEFDGPYPEICKNKAEILNKNFE